MTTFQLVKGCTSHQSDYARLPEVVSVASSHELCTLEYSLCENRLPWQHIRVQTRTRACAVRIYTYHAADAMHVHLQLSDRAVRQDQVSWPGLALVAPCMLLLHINAIPVLVGAFCVV